MNSGANAILSACCAVSERIQSYLHLENRDFLQSAAGSFTPAHHKNIPALAGLLVLVVLVLALASKGLAAGLPHHELSVTLDPGRHVLTAVDRISVPKDFPRTFTFALHAGLKPSVQEPGVRIKKNARRQGNVPLELFRVTLPPGATGFSVQYGGTIHHPLEAVGKSQARGFDQTPGSIADDGVYLADSSAWYPLLEAGLMTFSLTVQAPDGWDAVSQGGRTGQKKTKAGVSIGWDSPEPQEEAYLIASRFSRYERTADRITAQVFLRRPDEGLANKYLDATIRYIAMYEKLIGPYPYKKFALVENFWETGFGMPSFTLLGPTVIRLPFIINTSFPHEILHSWWGNSVYPVYEEGNWSEGLTAYLADHLLKEQQDGGPEYRLNTLQKYADYVVSGRDFPLTGFTSRHSPSTEAVGYGKSLMLFHMLRRALGDKTFIAGIRGFYRDEQFRFATFDDLRESLEKASGRDLRPEFDQWVKRTGAPEIKLRDAETGRQGEGDVVKAVLEQVQTGDPYRLHVPVAVTVEGSDKAVQAVIAVTGKKQDLSLATPGRPLRIDIDPEFDLFRRLDRDEIPPAITQALGAKKMLVLLPAAAGKDMLDAFRTFAASLSGAGPDEVEVKLDNEIKKLPVDSAIAVLGWENRFFAEMLPLLKQYDVAFSRESVRMERSEIQKENHAFVFTARSSLNRDAGLLFIAADRPQALPGLARKLPHYHKYSYLVFEGDEPSNSAKGRWPVTDSPLTAFLPDKNGKRTPVAMGRLAPREALAALPAVYSAERMLETVKFLSSERLRGREIGTPEIDQAAEYIAGMFKQAGLLPGGDEGSYIQVWEDRIRKAEMKNVIGVIPGKKPEFTGQSIVVGAHYDHLGTGASGRSADKGKVHPGADDNASGVAVLLELARVFRERPEPARSLVFVAFTGEEEGKLGSGHFVREEKKFPASKSIAMVNLDTVGRLDKRKLLVLGGHSAREWVHIFRGAGFVTGVEIEMVSEDLDSSDQKSFQEAGVPAVQLFSGPHLDYHRPSDTADKIDPAGLAKVAAVAAEAIEYLAGREEALTTTLTAGKPATGPKTERKVSLGTVPDFAYFGKGVRLSGTAEGSPAAAAGLKEGDIITGMNGRPVGSLKEFSDALKSLNPGDRISINYLRDGKQAIADATVMEK